MATTSGIGNNVTTTINDSLKSTATTSLADNFTTFLQLLTTQLKNQNPLDPLDTNQFTQQLVQFAQVEQQLKGNDQLASLVTLQQSAQSTQALGFVGHIVALDGETSRLENGSAGWSFNSSKPATATINILNSVGATVYSGTFSLNAGVQNFVWDGRNTSGVMQPDGDYKMSITAKDATGQTVAVATEVQGVVDSVDVSKTPPVLNVAGKDYTLDKIKRVVRYVAPTPEPEPETPETEAPAS
ncbi:flagellar hook assembly protein FlgD [Pseudorhodoplanes sinuspersici]|uniref:Basal-body rod modification protein FlgD n=1 Tax=Pseudorhodoplanes sinuspersici TaxID=1235591 RepID=A0A1W6ZU58_9HYPH|nr:flagellar hook capping FlgD N-terminal domain-containing protein [Pseudorhodoplanes sinuspersici]ARQ00295.1 flagellar biosynthesis protein FlgD [Pseudorhodoplanes sinuspersici]RKE67549.1 flagellar basal-body rod modification protein FlgD [Pseudorhodoplanes sinuspersici]